MKIIITYSRSICAHIFYVIDQSALALMLYIYLSPVEKKRKIFEILLDT